MYLDVAGHMLAFYGKKTNPRAGLLHDQGVVASKAIANIPTWMGYFARWRVQCISISEASEILAGCKRLEKESLRRARWDLQHRFSSMQLHSPLSASARPFQLRATPSSVLVEDAPQDYPAQDRGAVLLEAVLEVCLLERPPPITITLQNAFFHKLCKMLFTGFLIFVVSKACAGLGELL